MLVWACILHGTSASGPLTNFREEVDPVLLNRVRSVVVSSDNKNVYAVAYSGNSIVYWTRNLDTGALTNKKSVVSSTNLNKPYGVAVSPDGTGVFAVMYGGKSLVYWTRNTANGVLTNLV